MNITANTNFRLNEENKTQDRRGDQESQIANIGCDGNKMYKIWLSFHFWVTDVLAMLSDTSDSRKF